MKLTAASIPIEPFNSEYEYVPYTPEIKDLIAYWDLPRSKEAGIEAYGPAFLTTPPAELAGHLREIMGGDFETDEEERMVVDYIKSLQH